MGKYLTPLPTWTGITCQLLCLHVWGCSSSKKNREKYVNCRFLSYLSIHISYALRKNQESLQMVILPQQHSFDGIASYADLTSKTALIGCSENCRKIPQSSSRSQLSSPIGLVLKLHQKVVFPLKTNYLLWKAEN